MADVTTSGSRAGRASTWTRCWPETAGLWGRTGRERGGRGRAGLSRTGWRTRRSPWRATTRVASSSGLWRRCYKLAPVSDPAARPAFQELARKMSRQNDFLRHDYRFIPSCGDHYSSLKQLRRSIDAQRSTGKRRADMFVYAEPPGPEGTPLNRAIRSSRTTRT